MKSRSSLLLSAGLALALEACAPVQVTHVQPGQSLGVALAKKPQVVRLPAPPPSAAPTMTSSSMPDAGLPKSDNTAKVAEAFSRGEFCMNAGKDDEAIAAFQEAVKIQPDFTEGWQRLAALYEKKGDNKKAIEAFRRSKKIASQSNQG
jgi:tetratricopeptide (TPR) repeat protein